jgi:hypothetical protein
MFIKKWCPKFKKKNSVAAMVSKIYFFLKIISLKKYIFVVGYGYR